MLWNMLNDLAEAIKALDGKKSISLGFSGPPLQLNHWRKHRLAAIWTCHLQREALTGRSNSSSTLRRSLGLRTLVCCDLPAFPDSWGPCTNWRFTASAHVRTEPQCDIGHTPSLGTNFLRNLLESWNRNSQCKQRIYPVLNTCYYSLSGWYWTPGDIHNPTRKVAVLGGEGGRAQKQTHFTEERALFWWHLRFHVYKLQT